MPDTPDSQGGQAETILAFDFGLRRIGVAVGQTITGSASPLRVVVNGDNGPDFSAITAMVSEWCPSRLIVGLPMQADGSPARIQPQIDEFVEKLAHFQLPINTVDERYTSVEAKAVLKNARTVGSRGRLSKEMIDSAAAVFIAERFLTGQSNV